MAHFAKVLDGKVVNVIAAEPNFFDLFVDDSPGQWIQTSYNTQAGVHTAGKDPLRKNFAGFGYTYDIDRDAFIAPNPFSSWILNETTCIWEAPIPYPDDDQEYKWDEDTISWLVI